MTTLQRILFLKKQRNLSDLAFERELGLNDRLVSSWKRGISESYLKIIPQLAQYFSVTADYLLGLSEFPQGAAAALGGLSSDALRVGRLYDLADGDARAMVEIALRRFDAEAAAELSPKTSTA